MVPDCFFLAVGLEKQDGGVEIKKKDITFNVSFKHHFGVSQMEHSLDFLSLSANKQTSPFYNFQIKLPTFDWS